MFYDRKVKNKSADSVIS